MRAYRENFGITPGEVIAATIRGEFINIPEIENLMKSPGYAEDARSVIAYVESGFNWSDVSKKLFLHRNTIKYRIEKIENLLGVPLQGEPVNLLVLYVLLKQREVHTADAKAAGFTTVNVDDNTTVILKVVSRQAIKEENNGTDSGN